MASAKETYENLQKRFSELGARLCLVNNSQIASALQFEEKIVRLMQIATQDEVDRILELVQPLGS